MKTAIAFLCICLLASAPMLGQSQRFLTGLYLQGGVGTYRPFRSIHACYELGGTGSYPISNHFTVDVSLGYSHNGLSQGEYTKLAGTNNYLIERITRLNQARLVFGIGIPDRKRAHWTVGGYVATLLTAKERETRSLNGRLEQVLVDVADQFRRYDVGLQLAFHGWLSESLQIDIQVRQGLVNLRPGWVGVSTLNHAALIGLSWFPRLARLEK